MAPHGHGPSEQVQTPVGTQARHIHTSILTLSYSSILKEQLDAQKISCVRIMAQIAGSQDPRRMTRTPPPLQWEPVYMPRWKVRLTQWLILPVQQLCTDSARAHRRTAPRRLSKPQEGAMTSTPAACQSQNPEQRAEGEHSCLWWASVCAQGLREKSSMGMALIFSEVRRYRWTS